MKPEDQLCPNIHMREGRIVSCGAYMMYRKNGTQLKCPTCGYTKPVSQFIGIIRKSSDEGTKS